MAKQQRPKADKSRLGDLGEINQIAAQVTGKEQAGQVDPKKPSFTLADTKPPKEREPGLTAKGRVKFTTMLRKDLREKLQNIADNNAISVADVLERMIEEYFALGGK